MSLDEVVIKLKRLLSRNQAYKCRFIALHRSSFYIVREFYSVQWRDLLFLSELQIQSEGGASDGLLSKDFFNNSLDDRVILQ